VEHLPFGVGIGVDAAASYRGTGYGWISRPNIPPRGTIAQSETKEGALMTVGTAGKRAYLARLRRAEGQVRGLQRMVDQDAYCMDVLTQVSAATKALQAVAVGLMTDHLAGCVVEAAREGGDPAAARIREMTESVAGLLYAEREFGEVVTDGAPFSSVRPT
jgi:DNA-binding FrmR family transcriptional regulator